VGQAHGHDQVWQATAVALGCSGRRCHDVQCTPRGNGALAPARCTTSCRVGAPRP
jgi:hypothetical protein